MNRHTITKNVNQIKHYLERNNEIVLVFIIILVGLSAFGLGRLSALENMREPVQILQAPADGQGASLTIGGKVVASRKGSKYHAPWCTGATQMSEKNKIWFKNEGAARKAGYTPASNCKGLK